MVTTAAVLTDETASKTRSYTALLTTTMDAVTTTAGTATNNANDMMHVDTATAALPPNDSTPDMDSFTYSHKEVQELLEDAKLDGYQEGFEEGHRIGRKTGHKEGKEEGHSEGHMEGYKYGYDVCWQIDERRQEEVHRKGLLEGYKLGMQNGKDEERKKWLTEGHGAGLCILMAAHTHALFCGMVLLEEAETQTDAITTTNIDIQTTLAVSTIADFSTQTVPSSSIDAIMQMAIATTNASTQTTTNTNVSPRQQLATLETVTDDNKPLPLARKCCKSTKWPYQPPSTTTDAPSTFHIAPQPPASHHEPAMPQTTSHVSTMPPHIPSEPTTAKTSAQANVNAE